MLGMVLLSWERVAVILHMLLEGYYEEKVFP